MKVLVVGGTGLIGGDIALYLTSRGHNVTIMARKPSVVPCLAALPWFFRNAARHVADPLGSTS